MEFPGVCSLHTIGVTMTLYDCQKGIWGLVWLAVRLKLWFLESEEFRK